MDFEKELFDSIDKRLTSIETKLDNTLVHCETECVKKFASKATEAKADKLWEWKIYIAGGAAVVMFIIGWLVKVM